MEPFWGCLCLSDVVPRGFRVVSNCLSLDMVLKSFNPVETYMRKVQRGFKGLLEAVGALEEFHSCTEEAWRPFL